VAGSPTVVKYYTFVHSYVRRRWILTVVGRETIGREFRLGEVKELQEEVDEPETVRRTWTLDNLPVRRAVFIDSTWNQSRGIYADARVRGLRTVVLQNRLSQFWRHQRGSPRWYLATIEAIHQFLLEVHINAWGLNTAYRGLDNLEITAGFHQLAEPLTKTAASEDLGREAPYNGQYDNLLFFFAHMYDPIHKYYEQRAIIHIASLFNKMTIIALKICMHTYM